MAKLLTSAFLLTSLNVWAMKCPSDLNLVAKELVELQLSGAFLTGQTKCLKQENFKYITASNQSSMELVSKPDILLKKEQTEIRLGAITKVALGVYRVEVALKHKEKVYPESFSFILLNFEPKEKGEPLDCAGVIDQMTHNFVYEECFEKGNTLK